MPERIQMTRQRPWRADHPDAVIVARPTKWGNPFRVGEPGVPDAAAATAKFRRWLTRSKTGRVVATVARDELRGRDLACWCPLDAPCHADVLLEIANAAEEAK